MNLFHKILSRPEFVDNPPVLLDIGASGAIHPKWTQIARYSICIAFDADDREMGYSVDEASGYRKLYVYNRIVTDSPIPRADFFLTSSPYCSSLLRPYEDKLQKWAFGDLFKVQKIVQLEAVSLPQVLADVGVKQVDWFKTDSQGTDLRLFKSLGDAIVNHVIVAEFEPGIIDAYEGEDKLWQVMQYMEEHPFWMNGIQINGSLRLRNDIFNDKQILKNHLGARIRSAPGWGEVSFMHTFDAMNGFGEREFLLGWVFAVIERQFGFALELAIEGKRRFNAPIYGEMEAYVIKRLKSDATNRILNFIRRCANKVVRVLDTV